MPLDLKKFIVASGISQKQMAKNLGWHESKLTKLVLNKQEAVGSDLQLLARYFQVEMGALFRDDPHLVETSVSPRSPKEITEAPPCVTYQFSLVTVDKEHRQRLRDFLEGYETLRKEGSLLEQDGCTRIILPSGRTLLGRAVGALWMSFDRSLQPAKHDFPAEMRLSIARNPDPYEDDPERTDRNFSRYHCDITVSSERPEAVLYVAGANKWVRVESCYVESGQAIILDAPVSKLSFPNGESFDLEIKTIQHNP